MPKICLFSLRPSSSEFQSDNFKYSRNFTNAVILRIYDDIRNDLSEIMENYMKFWLINSFED